MNNTNITFIKKLALAYLVSCAVSEYMSGLIVEDLYNFIFHENIKQLNEVVDNFFPLNLLFFCINVSISSFIHFCFFLAPSLLVVWMAKKYIICGGWWMSMGAALYYMCLLGNLVLSEIFDLNKTRNELTRYLFSQELASIFVWVPIYVYIFMWDRKNAKN